MTVRLVLNSARPPAPGAAVALGRRVVDSGWDGAGFADSPRLFADPWLEADRVLTGTTAPLAGPCVASLGLRAPASVAAAVTGLEVAHPGRALLVVGRGESSVRNEGLPVPTLKEYGPALATVRDLVPPELVTSGRLLGASSGPQSITRTAKALGGVLLDVGVDPGVVTASVHHARSAEPDVTVWMFVRAAITDSEESAIAATEPLLGSCATRMAAAPDWYGLCEEKLAAVREVAGRHDYRRHGTARMPDGGPTVGDTVVQERFFFTGSAEQIVDRLRPFSSLGIQGVVVAGAVPGVDADLPGLGRALRQGLGGNRG